jgi:flagellar hook protein FlgE
MAVGSFSAGLSGLNANAVALNVIGNNLANINTAGFKASTVTFADLVSQSVSGWSANPMQVGLGVVLGSISPDFSQGSTENTREATNVAIQGAGFFVVRGPNGLSYTRAGNFSFDASGTLVSPEGYYVQGYTTVDATTGAIVPSGTPADLTVPPGVLRAPKATTEFETLTNLDANAASAATFTTSVQIFDGLGRAHVATITYTKGTTAGAWGYTVTVPGADVTGGTTGTPYPVSTGTLAFATSGRLSALTPAAPSTGGGSLPADPNMDVTFTTPTWISGAAASTLTWDITDASNDSSITGFASASATSSIGQNGAAPGMIDNISIGSDGTIRATFGAGQTVAVGQLAISTFNNPKGLAKLGSNRYGQSESAGLPNTGVAGTGGRGGMIGSALEQSNVDIAQQFTQMILAQRGYQANSKSITVADELLMETLSLKR